jgi:hypothetical protein
MRNVAERAQARKSEFIRVEREIDGEGWLVLRRSHGWLHGSRDAAIADARTMGMAVLDGGRA